MEPENITSFTVATCVLHNIFKTRGEVFSDSWSEKMQEVRETAARHRHRQSRYSAPLEQQQMVVGQLLCGIVWQHSFWLLQKERVLCRPSIDQC